jgi:hypothetical protein
MRNAYVSTFVGCFTVVLALFVFASPARAGGLYDDDKNVTGGVLKDRDYWRAKWANERMDEAIKERQPEGALR